MGQKNKHITTKKIARSELIQVNQSIGNEKTRNRELRALRVAGKELNCKKLTVITLSESGTIQNNGSTIQVVPAIEWMRKVYKVD